jgi:hypothetical protein
MVDVAPARSRTLGINQRVPAIPMSEWRIKTSDQLQDHLKQWLEKLPPYLTTKRAAELNGGSRSKLYEDADAGYIKSVRDNGSRLWETLSIVLRLANLPPAPNSPPPGRESPSPPPSPRLGSRRSRRQPISPTTKPTASPAPVTAPRVQPVEVLPPAPERAEQHSDESVNATA